MNRNKKRVNVKAFLLIKLSFKYKYLPLFSSNLPQQLGSLLVKKIKVQRFAEKLIYIYYK